MTAAGLARVIAALKLTPSAEELADALWLARHLPPQRCSAPEPGPRRATVHEKEQGVRDTSVGAMSGSELRRPADSSPPVAATVHLPSPRATDAARGHPSGTVRVPGVPALPDSLGILRALRPLRLTTPSRSRMRMEEERTACRIADGGPWLPVLVPERERSHDLALVVDRAASMPLWQRTVAEMGVLFRRLGAFRDVRVWSFDGSQSPDAPLALSAEHSAAGGARAAHRRPAELVDPTGRRLILIVSDCVGGAWAGQPMMSALRLWAGNGNVAVVNLLPQRLWYRCLPDLVRVRLSASAPGTNGDLRVRVRDSSLDVRRGGPAVPVVRFDPRWLSDWAKVVAGTAGGGYSGSAVFPALARDVHVDQMAGAEPAPAAPSALERLRQFRAMASPTAFRLAGHLSAAPLSLPVMRLVQRAMLPESGPEHLAEFYLSGLIRRTGPAPGPMRDEDLEYDFLPGVRELLLTTEDRSNALAVLQTVSRYISMRAGASLDFRAVLAGRGGSQLHRLGRPFAAVADHVLLKLGVTGTPYSTTADAQEVSQAPAGHTVDIGADRRTAASDTSLGPHALRSSAGAYVTEHDQASPGDQLPDRQTQGLDTVPPRNFSFTGRELLLEALHDRLTSGVTALLPQALHGLGGVGKTQLAIEYAYRYAHEYDLVWWVPSERVVLLRSSMAGLASALRIPDTGDLDRTLSGVRERLNSGDACRRWLFVFDNAGRPEDVAEYFAIVAGRGAPPEVSGHILVTSRDPSWAALADPIEVDVFERDESISFLGHRLQHITADQADRLAARLEDLPMALEQAASLLASASISTDDYLGRFEERRQALDRKALPPEYPLAIAVTVSLALDGLAAEPAALQLLELTAFLAAEPISRALLWAGRSAPLPEKLRGAMRIENRLKSTIRQLGRFGLARVDPTLKSLQVHRLVRSLLQSRLTEDETRGYLMGAQDLISAADPGDPDDPTTWPRYEELAPHLLHVDAVGGESEAVRQAVLHQIRYLYARGDYDSSRTLGQAAFDRWTTALGTDHEQTLYAGFLLANTMRARGEMTEARAINQRTLDLQREVIGEDDDTTLAVANSVGADLRLQGRFPEAARLDEENLTRHRRAFGDAYQGTLRCANNLAVDLRLLGDFSGALQLDQETYRRRNLLFPTVAHPETFSSLSGIVLDLCEMGEYRAAREWFEGSEHFRRALGDYHPAVMLAVRRYALVLRRLGEYPKARDLARDNHSRYREKFGERIPDSLAALVTLANCERAAGESRAVAHLERAAVAYEETLGADHPLTLYCAIDRAVALRVAGEVEAAREIDERAVAALFGVVGEDHPFALTGAAGLASDLHLHGEYRAARDLSERVWVKSCEVRGGDHPMTLACAHNLSLDRRADGDAESAGRLAVETRASLRARLGREHPEFRSAVNDVRAELDIFVPST